MATTSKQLMDYFYKANRLAIAKDACDVAGIFSLAENLVNNIHHGKEDSVWLESFLDALGRNRARADEPTTVSTYSLIIEFTKAFADAPNDEVRDVLFSDLVEDKL